MDDFKPAPGLILFPIMVHLILSRSRQPCGSSNRPNNNQQSTHFPPERKSMPKFHVRHPPWQCMSFLSGKLQQSADTAMESTTRYRPGTSTNYRRKAKERQLQWDTLSNSPKHTWQHSNQVPRSLLSSQSISDGFTSSPSRTISSHLGAPCLSGLPLMALDLLVGELVST